ncbi:hypothetical protein PTKIN_Ptkin04bG0106500 [Pterospermum kingtungense]
MKTITAVVLLVLFLFSTKSCFAKAAKEPVFDRDGDELRTGVEYNIHAAFYGPSNGFLDLGSPTDKFCPKFVIQSTTESNFGRPAVFYPAKTSESVVQESTDVNIMFLPGLDAYCRTSTVWKIDDYDPSFGKWWVTTGGVRGNPGPQTLTSWFKFEKVRSPYVIGNWYNIRFCPSVCESCAILCNNITTFYSEEQLRLTLSPSGTGRIFSFVKASTAIKEVVGKQSE